MQKSQRSQKKMFVNISSVVMSLRSIIMKLTLAGLLETFAAGLHWMIVSMACFGLLANQDIKQE